MNTGPKNLAEPLPDKGVLEHLVSARLVRAAFQPIVNCQSGETTGFEALARPTPGSGVPDPGVLFDMAEKYRMLWPVEAVTRATAFACVEGFPNGILLFVNSTPEVFCHERFVETVEADVKAVPGLTPSRIVLEITERGGADDLARIAHQATRLRALGFQIAIDDVGAGTSGLNRIMTLRPHWLKLDRELVSGIDQDRYKLNLIRFLVHFARLAGVNVIGEGVERTEEMLTLINLGVRYVQGYLTGRPAFDYQLVDPQISRTMRQSWSQAESARLIDPRRTQLSRICEPPEKVQAATPIRDLALGVLRSPGHVGAAVLDGTRLVGWVSRETVLSAARRTDAKLAVGFICTSDLGTLPPSATLSEAMEHVASREGASIADPVLVAEHDRIVGVVTLQKLLGACSREGRIDADLPAGLTGLPSKVDGEKRVKAIIKAQNAAQPSVDGPASFAGLAAPLSAAFIDVRGFADFNGACGYDAGDRLIQELAELSRATLLDAHLPAAVPTAGPAADPTAGDPTAGDNHAELSKVFVAHIGDDRFMVTAPAEIILARWPALAAGFERLTAAEPANESTAGKPEQLFLAGTATHAANAEPPTPVASAGARLGLRLVLLDGVFARVSSPRELTELEAGVRRAARAAEGPSAPRCLLHVDRSEPLRASA